jgi:threonine/homoserine/homoserine lactone efflux protein
LTKGRIMSLEFYLAYVLAYVLACVVVVIVPGPTVTVIVANSLMHGARAGLLNIAGTQLGLAVMMGHCARRPGDADRDHGDLVRRAAAGRRRLSGVVCWKLLRSPGSFADPQKVSVPRGGFFLRGFLVLISNPKALLLFGAFILQIVNPNADCVGQVVLLGVTAMVTAGIFDTAYAIVAGRARTLLSPKRVRLVSRVSGGFLISGGLWLALTRAR